MIKKIIASFIILLCFYYSNAQSICECITYKKELDSLMDVSPTASNYKLLNKLFNSSEYICQAKGFLLRANMMFIKKELDSAINDVLTVEKMLIKNKCPENALKNPYRLASNIYENISDYDNAIQYSLKALEIIEKSDNPYETGEGNFAVAQIFNNMKQYDKGLSYCRKVVPYINKLPDSIDKIILLNKTASIHLNYYEIHKSQNSLDTAFHCAGIALKFAKKINDVNAGDERVKAWLTLSTVYMIQKDYRTSLKIIDSALQSSDPVWNSLEMAGLYKNKAEIMISQQNLSEAKRFADSVLYYNQQMENQPSIAESYQLLYKISMLSGNYKAALEAILQQKQINDSIVNVKNIHAVNELEKKYNQSQNERKINDLAQQKKMYALLALAGLLLVGLIAFFMRQQTLKHRQKILETEQRLNRARMNPHFFFNALASLQNFAMQDNDSITMAENLSKFSHIMRETLENTYREYVTIEQEMTFLEEYLELQSIRFPHKFSYTITADKELEIDDLMIPSMILQPFVENSIEHGFLGLSYTGVLALHFTKENNEIKITVTDNGKGLQYSVKSNTAHISRASQIIKDRIYLLNIKLKTNARFNIANNEQGEGVYVVIHLPVLYSENIT